MVAARENEKQWIELAMDGDFDSFASLYTCHLETIYRYIFYRTGHTQDAEDLTEQVFLKAWEALPSYRQTKSGFINWLYRIAHNLVVDHHRRQKWIVDDRIQDDQDPPTDSQDAALESLILEEEASALAGAIRKLPEEYQQVIILRFIQGLGHEEVSRIIDKSEVTCRSIQHRALVSLNKILTGEQERM